MALNIGINTDSGVTTNYHKVLSFNWGGEFVTENIVEAVLDENNDPVYNEDGALLTSTRKEFILDSEGDKIPEIMVLVVSYFNQDTRQENLKAVVGKTYRVGVSMNDLTDNFITLAYKALNQIEPFIGATEV